MWPRTFLQTHSWKRPRMSTGPAQSRSLNFLTAIRMGSSGSVTQRGWARTPGRKPRLLPGNTHPLSQTEQRNSFHVRTRISHFKPKGKIIWFQSLVKICIKHFLKNIFNEILCEKWKKYIFFYKLKMFELVLIPPESRCVKHLLMFSPFFVSELR